MQECYRLCPPIRLWPHKRHPFVSYQPVDGADFFSPLLWRLLVTCCPPPHFFLCWKDSLWKKTTVCETKLNTHAQLHQLKRNKIYMLNDIMKVIRPVRVGYNFRTHVSLDYVRVINYHTSCAWSSVGHMTVTYVIYACARNSIISQASFLWCVLSDSFFFFFFPPLLRLGFSLVLVGNDESVNASCSVSKRKSGQIVNMDGISSTQVYS